MLYQRKCSLDIERNSSPKGHCQALQETVEGNGQVTIHKDV